MELERPHEFRKSANERLLKERFGQILKSFNWELFYEILDKHKKKSGLKVLTKEEKVEREKVKEKVFFDFSVITGTKFEMPNELPSVKFDDSIKAIANANRANGRRGTITININRLENYIKIISKHMEKNNVKIDFDIVYISCLKVFMHELLHLSGYIENDTATTYNSINEAITEMLSFRVMQEYMNANGDGNVEKVWEMYNKYYFSIYDDEKGIVAMFVKILSNLNEVTSRAFTDSLYKAYLNNFDVSKNEFVNSLPENIGPIWKKFIRLAKFDKDNHAKEVEEIMDSLDKIIKDQNIKPLV